MQFSFMTRSQLVRTVTLATLICTLGAARIRAAEEDGIVRDVGVSNMDKTFAIEAAHGILRDKALANLAQHRAQSPKVRKFAIELRDRREKAHARLRTLAEETRLRLPERLDMYQRQQVKKLASLTGEQFDRQFLQYIAETDYIRFYQFELRNGALRVYPPVAKFAREQLPVLRKNMQRARQLLEDYR